jgi:uracil-DNA glycosylase
VFLLNTILTVEESKPLSHQKIGWETFTSNVINELLKQEEKIIFLCLGNNAKKIFKDVKTHHYIVETSHPSPLGAYRGFIGSNVFKDINDILMSNNKETINWEVK